MSKSDDDPYKAGYGGKVREYGISDDDNREYEKGRLDRQTEEQTRYRNEWGGDDKRK
jgi:hypothetical protein